MKLSSVVVVVLLIGAIGVRSEDVPLADPQFHPSRNRPVGWRGDGTGCYLGAKPPTEWDTFSGNGILWKTPMPSWSMASPIVVNSKVIVLSEPHTVLCYDATTGKKIWHNATDVFDAQLPSAEAQQKRKLWEQIELGWSIGRDNYKRDNRDTYAPGERALGEAIRAQLKGTKYWDAQRDWVQYNPQDFSQLGLWINGYQNAVGRTQSPALSDGQWVWVVFGTHTAACYELETGKTRWIRFLGGLGDIEREVAQGMNMCHSGVGCAFTPAPQLVAGKLLIMHLRALQALDPDTGQNLWKTPLASLPPPGFRNGGHKGAGTFAALRVGAQWVAVTPCGQAVRLADGKVVSESVGAYMDGAGSSPIADDDHDMVYYFDATCGGSGNTEMTYGVHLQWREDKLIGEVVWKQPDVYDRVMSVVYRGLIYGPEAGVLDARTGAVRFPPRQKFRTASCGWTLAGDILFGISDSGKIKTPLKAAMWRVEATGDLEEVPGTRLIQEPEGPDEFYQRMVQAWRDGVLSWRTPSPVWFHKVMDSNHVVGNHPFFHGTRMYLRTYGHLYCIGH